jgi:hypothetical protein
MLVTHDEFPFTPESISIKRVDNGFMVEICSHECMSMSASIDAKNTLYASNPVKTTNVFETPDCKDKGVMLHNVVRILDFIASAFQRTVYQPDNRYKICIELLDQKPAEE